jgi:hypothetical protein
VLRRIFGPKRDEAKRKWRKLHNEEFNDLYCPSNIFWLIKSGRMGKTGYVARMGERRGVYGILVGKLEGRRPLVRPRQRWKYNININLQEVGYEGVDLIDLTLIRTGGGRL